MRPRRDEYEATASSMSTPRPSLPRLKNKLSIGRLNAYGGVLDFEAVSSSTHTTVPPVPSFYRAPAAPAPAASSSLAGPASPFTQQESSKQCTHEQGKEYTQHTPPKNTTQATLRAVKTLNKQHVPINKYSTPAIMQPSHAGISTLDTDHPQADQTAITISRSHQSQPIEAILSVPTSSSDGVVAEPALDACCSSSVGCCLSGGSGNTQGETSVERDEDRLAREIREDMDDSGSGGYASLEQVRPITLIQSCICSCTEQKRVICLDPS